jgi:DMSO/TMAO reductase YedYZ molybdopterin-dependent catalytic subunit
MQSDNKSLGRRAFMKKAVASSIGMALGCEIAFAEYLPAGYLPIGLFADPLPGKDPRMTVLNERPINAETPPHLLDAPETPNTLFFVRNNGIPPLRQDIDPNSWTLSIEGESVQQKKQFTLPQLKSRFPRVTLKLTLECGGNGRSEFNPAAKGNQWSTGAVGCAAWTGVRLRDVLNDVGLKDSAKYIGYYGKDTHLSGDPKKQAISRGVPISKALEAESLIAWQMNGKELPLLNGYPLRLVFGGWPASCSGKWLHKIVVRDRVHDGQKMGGQSYRVPCSPVAPGTKVKDEDMCIIESMPVKSLITYPKTGAMLRLGQKMTIRGHAWAGDHEVSAMHYSIDFGASWQTCQLSKPVNRLAWQQWTAQVNFPKKGYYEVWARATDAQGKMQPMLVPGWNPKGYLNNACHRIAVKVIA